MAAIFNAKNMKPRELGVLVAALAGRVQECERTIEELANEPELVLTLKEEIALITDWIDALDPDNA